MEKSDQYHRWVEYSDEDSIYIGRRPDFSMRSRMGGRFYWRQVENAASTGAMMIMTAMFDEVDEATAMFKTVAKKEDSPEGFLTLDQDGETLQNDWYLRLSGEASKLMRKEIPVTGKVPIKP